MPFFTNTLTPSTTTQNLMANRQGMTKAIQFSVVVRSMGTATYVALGGVDSQDRRLTSVGSGISVSANYPRRWVNPSEVFVISDTADAVIEVFGEAFTEV